MCEPCKDLLPDYTPYFLCETDKIIESDGDVIVSGTSTPNTKLIYWAVSPITTGYSFSGSGLAYPSYKVGIEGTPNIGSTMTRADGTFQFRIQMPNSYYNDNGTLVPPEVKIKPCNSDKVAVVDLGPKLPNRETEYDTRRTGPLFYSNCSHLDSRLPCVRDQNQILNASKYGIKYETFWGDVPPH